MNRRERFLKTMTWGRPDRPASADYFAYDSTRARWEREGLPRGVDLNEYFGMDFDPFRWNVGAALGPLFEAKTLVLEESAEFIVEKHASGAIVRRLKNEPPPAMPQWLRYPLENRKEWELFRLKLDPDLPGRLPANLAELAGASAFRDYPLGMWLGGTFGVLRDWWGLENLSYLFYDDPALIEEMLEVLTHLALNVFERVQKSGVQLDWVMFWEDMAYKNGSLLHPELYRRYCLPFYRKMMAHVQSAGIQIAMLDSDGDISQLIPLWREVGVTVMHPLEVAAGMDVVALRKQYGKSIGFFGGIDKRVLATTPEHIRRYAKPILEACLAEGGFIPACDHAVPPDVSLDNYRCYRDLVHEVSGKI